MTGRREEARQRFKAYQAEVVAAGKRDMDAALLLKANKEPNLLRRGFMQGLIGVAALGSFGITPQRVLADFYNKSQSPTLPVGFTSLLQYGADPSGTIDSTAAFTAAAAVNKIILVPPGTYKLANFQPSSGSSMIGLDGHNFYANVNSIVAPVTLVPVVAGTTNIFDMHLGPSNVHLSGMDLNGTGATTASGITSGGKSLTLRDLTVRNFTGWGLGGSFAGGNADSFESHIHDCDFLANGIGMGDMIDCWIFGGSCTSNGTNVQFVSGDFSGAVTFIGHRNEWSTSGYGFQITGGDTLNQNPGSKTRFTGGHFDRNFNGAVDINNASRFDFTGTDFTRNGSVAAGGAVSCQMRLNGATNVLITGCGSNWGADDGGGGNISPTVWMRFAGTNTDITIVGNDMTGYRGDTSTALGGLGTHSNSLWRGATTLPVTRYTEANNDGTV